MPYHQESDPTGSLLLSALLALSPLLVLLGLLGLFRWKAHWAGVATFGVSLLIAVGVYGMPPLMAINAGLYGAAQSVLLILWLTFNAIWIYNLTVHSGHFSVLRRAFSSVGEDIRIQAIVIAFSFGALLEALAGGGGPVAICSVMLIALGVRPLKAATLALIANTAPVAFGGMGNPITVLGEVTGLPAGEFGAMAGRQVSLLAIAVPFVLLYVADGKRGLRQAWPGALVGGVTFAVAQFVTSILAYQLADIVAAVASAAALLLLLRIWSPAGEPVTAAAIAGGGGAVEEPDPTRDSRSEVLRAFAPYTIIILVFSLVQFDALRAPLEAVGTTFAWPGLDVVSTTGAEVSTDYEFAIGSATGTLLLLSGLLSLPFLRVAPGDAALVWGRTVRQFGWAILAILAVFALSYVMNLSGQISTLGAWLATTGSFFAFLSPIVGWFGVTITGTDAGANALFGKLQTTTATQIGADPVLLGAANSSGGVMAKMISPQNLAVGTAAVGLVGQEGVLFRRIFGWSLLLLLAVCVLVFLQSTPALGWMVP
ncbi:lactate permease [Saccharopolyspora lacisalsi]|uniref:L-lactate permease n=1 Tax=Halosaccharopolyspora lacisalsi TaxID=1000566 RepID=A0A839DWN9_9PSEU|nr:L-lactate permease [Halosaccharopolyspora lacisalsi]MBA8823755.1 lactate permease [Halosaccharopolyspora lacisalsi]